MVQTSNSRWWRTASCFILQIDSDHNNHVPCMHSCKSQDMHLDFVNCTVYDLFGRTFWSFYKLDKYWNNFPSLAQRLPKPRFFLFYISNHSLSLFPIKTSIEKSMKVTLTKNNVDDSGKYSRLLSTMTLAFTPHGLGASPNRTSMTVVIICYYFTIFCKFLLFSLSSRLSARSLQVYEVRILSNSCVIE